MLNAEQIQMLAHSNDTASAIFLLMHERRRGRTILNLTLFKRQLKIKGVKISEKDFYTTFKTLQHMAAGDLIYGRNGSPDVFRWQNKGALKMVSDLGINIKATSKVELPSPRPIEKNSTVTVLERTGDHITVSIPLELLIGLK